MSETVVWSVVSVDMVLSVESVLSVETSVLKSTVREVPKEELSEDVTSVDVSVTLVASVVSEALSVMTVLTV